MNSLFDTLGNKGPQNPLLNNQGRVPNAQQAQEELRAAVGQLKNDPSGFLAKAGKTIPQGMTDSGAIINHLISSGQVPLSRYAQIMNRSGPAKR